MTDAKPVHRIAVANQKGGVGKTTTAVSIAGELAARGEHVLLVDSDPQGNATTCLGISKRHLRATTYDVLIGAARIDDARLSTGRVGLDLLPANDDLAGAMIELAHVERRDYRLRDALQSISAYSYIVIDSPPSLGLLTINALCAVDYIIVPLQCEYLALEGLAQLKTTVDRIRQQRNPRLDIAGVVMTMYDSRTNLANQVVSEVRRFFPTQVFETLIPRGVRASEAPSHGQLIREYDPVGRTAQAYASLTREIVERIAGQERFT